MYIYERKIYKTDCGFDMPQICASPEAPHKSALSATQAQASPQCRGMPAMAAMLAGEAPAEALSYEERGMR